MVDHELFQVIPPPPCTFANRTSEVINYCCAKQRNLFKNKLECLFDKENYEYSWHYEDRRVGVQHAIYPGVPRVEGRTLQAHFVSKNKSVEPLNINLEGRLGVESWVSMWNQFIWSFCTAQSSLPTIAQPHPSWYVSHSATHRSLHHRGLHTHVRIPIRGCCPASWRVMFAPSILAPRPRPNDIIPPSIPSDLIYERQ